MDRHFLSGPLQPLTGSEIERDAGPAPVVYEDLHGGIGGHWRCRGDPGFFPVRGNGLAIDLAFSILTNSNELGEPFERKGPDGTEDLILLVAYRISLKGHRRLHRCERQDLKQVTLKHVPDHPCFLIVRGPVLNAKSLSHGDLYMINVVAVPERLENGIGKAEHQHILDRLFGSVVV